MKHAWRTIYMRVRAAFGLTLVAISGCVAAPEAPDSASLDPLLTLEAYDARGADVAFDALPRHPQFVLSSTGTFESGAPLLLFRGPPDAALIEDLAGLPLRAAHDARRIESTTRNTTRRLELIPLAALDSAERYTLAVPATALGDELPFVAELGTSGGPTAGAAWLGTSPPAGASGVPRNLGALLLALDGDARGAGEGVWLEDPDKLAVPSHLSPWSCDEIDSQAVACFRLELAGLLRPAAHYRVRSGRALRDAHGAEVGALDAAFATGSVDDVRPPSLDALACLRDERQVAIGCVWVSETSVRIRLRADEPIRAVVRSGERRAARLLPEGAGSIELLRLAADAPFELELEAFDLAGNSAQARLLLRTESALPALTITEVLADPAGPEPAQEYVEIANFGASPASLQGVSLVDGEDDRPTVVTAVVELAAGARALLVADDFDPNNTLDPAPPPGARLIRIGPALTRSGLANAGERLILRDAAARRLSSVPALPAGRGRCIRRDATADLRGDAPADFDEADCTPGR